MERMKSILKLSGAFYSRLRAIVGGISLGLMMGAALGIDVGDISPTALVVLAYVALFVTCINATWRLEQLQTPKIEAKLIEALHYLEGPDAKARWLFDIERVDSKAQLVLKMVLEIAPKPMRRVTLKFSMRDIAYGGIDCTGKPRVVVAGFGEERKQYTGPHPHKDSVATIDTYLPDAMILCYFNLEPKALEDFIQQVVRATDFSCLLIIETRGDNGKALRIPVTADAKSMRRRAREVLEHYAGTVQDKGKLPEYIELLRGNEPEGKN